MEEKKIVGALVNSLKELFTHDSADSAGEAGTEVPDAELLERLEKKVAELEETLVREREALHQARDRCAQLEESLACREREQALAGFRAALEEAASQERTPGVDIRDTPSQRSIPS